MKLMTVEMLNKKGNCRLEITGRNCRDPIRVSDELRVKGEQLSALKVVGIEAYNRRIDELPSGYVGTIEVEIVAGDGPGLDGELIG